MIRNPMAQGLKAAKAKSYVTWFILGVLGHILTLAWAAIATPRVPMAVDEESPTGSADHELFEKKFQQHAKTERMRYAKMGAHLGFPLQALAAMITIFNAIPDSSVPDAEQFAATTPTEQAEPANAATPVSSTPDLPTDVPVRETLPNTVSVQMPENSDAADAGGAEDTTVAEVLAGYDCTPSIEHGWYDCTRRVDGWLEPTGTWRGKYGEWASPTTTAIEIQFGAQTTTRYPDSGCAGTLTPTGRTPGSVDAREYRETLTTGGNRCMNNGLVTLRRTGDAAALEFEWILGNRSRTQVWEGVLSQTEN